VFWTTVLAVEVSTLSTPRLVDHPGQQVTASGFRVKKASDIRWGARRRRPAGRASRAADHRGQLVGQHARPPLSTDEAIIPSASRLTRPASGEVRVVEDPRRKNGDATPAADWTRPDHEHEHRSPSAWNSLRDTPQRYRLALPADFLRMSVLFLMSQRLSSGLFHESYVLPTGLNVLPGVSRC